MSKAHLKRTGIPALLFLLTVILCALPVPARADLTILPTRIVFEGRDRFADVTLVNTGDKQSTYEMGWRFFRMQETGVAYEEVESSLTPFDLTEHIVFTPRRVTLAPDAKQKIRMALRPPAELPPPGDYRAHFEIRTVPEPQEVETPGESNMGAAVRINVGYTIPVTYQVGENTADAAIETVSLGINEQSGLLEATVPITRTGGPYSTHGYLYVYHQPASGPEILVGEVSNAHIFPEIDRRIFTVTLLTRRLTGGALRVVYAHYDKEENLVYDEKIFPIGN